MYQILPTVNTEYMQDEFQDADKINQMSDSSTNV